MFFVNQLKFKSSVNKYIDKRLSNMLANVPKNVSNKIIKSYMNDIISSDKISFIPFLLEKNMQDIDLIIQNFSSLSLKEYPLFDNEKILAEDIYTLLTNESDEVARPLFLRQETNLAEIFIAMPGKVLKNGVIEDASQQENSRPSALDDSQDVQSSETSPAHLLALAKLVGSALLDAAGSYIWDQVKREVLNIDDLPSYYIKVYEELRRIIDANYQRHNMDIMRSTATAFDLAITDWNATRNPQNFYIAKHKIFELLGWSNEIGHAGVFGYAEATILHIMTLQEEYIEAKRQRKEPEDLLRIKVHISKSATQYAVAVRKKHDALISDRMAEISPQLWVKHFEWFTTNEGRRVGGVLFGPHFERTDERGHPAGCGLIQEMQYQFTGVANNRFDDKRNGFWHSVAYGNWQHELQHGWNLSWTLANNALQQYRSFIHQRTHADLEALRAVAAALDALAQRPIGKE